MELETKKSGDNTIAQFCVNYIAKNSTEVVALVTRDTILRLKAQALGVACEDYRKFNVASSVGALYSGVATIERDDVVVSDFYSKEEFFLPEDVEAFSLKNYKMTVDFLEQVLSNYIVIGYDLDNVPFVISSNKTQKDADALKTLIAKVITGQDLNTKRM